LTHSRKQDALSPSEHDESGGRRAAVGNLLSVAAPDGSAPASPRPFDEAAIARAIRDVLVALGEDPDREGLKLTPQRVARMYSEILGGLLEDPEAHLEVGFEEQHREMVILRDIPFFSMCEHHLLPFQGAAHVAYIPRGRIVGISKLARVVDILARRPQVQERLTSQIADLLERKLQPLGVAVVIQADHLCMTMRGIKKPGSKVVTSANRGVFRKNPATRAEFMSLLNDAKG
jgi:GTP cyclohydrolase I